MNIRKYIIKVVDYGASCKHPDIDYCAVETSKSLDEVMAVFEIAVKAYNKEADPHPECLIEYVQEKMEEQGIKLYKCNLIPDATAEVAGLTPSGIFISK